ncbi:MAG: replication-associated recombination protein A [Armatimonadetes bacterium]|nr:replication-associated recombination protein A [Armatimonadota bacterium]MDW8121203.1 replication-associated recombination protein A [Armatimonadota bacterium]
MDDKTLQQRRLNGIDRAEESRQHEPLASRLRPRTLSEVVGQEHLLGPGKPLRVALEGGKPHSAILWGPPGCGKSTIALLFAQMGNAHFEPCSAVQVGVAEVRQIIETARQRLRKGKRTILFLDEVHRFNKAQQDALLPAIEDGSIIFIGATTENPFFYLTPPLLSRCRLYRLNPLTHEQILSLLRKCLTDPQGLGTVSVEIDEDALHYIADKSGGDARRALNALEAAYLTALSEHLPEQQPVRIVQSVVESVMAEPPLAYQRSGDDHYDIASAFIKSIRGSDPDAAVYWLARFLASGEDPRFIARRMVISASEDIGNADPQALFVAVSAAQAAEIVGMPEAQIVLAQAAVYLATAPKSNAAYRALERATATINEEGPRPVPLHLRDSSYKGAKRLGHGEGYRYPHDFPDHYVEQDYLPSNVPNRPFYRPSRQGYEAVIRQRMAERGQLKNTEESS